LRGRWHAVLWANADELVLGLGQGRGGCTIEADVGFIAASAGVGAG
jgi:hypothetical protein